PRFHQLNTDYLSQLQAAGAEPQDIDIVLCTHLHADHVGWNTRLENGTWVPTFPNAKYLCSDRDDQRFNPSRNAAIERERAMIYNDSVLPIAESGQLVLVSGNHEIDSRMIVEPAPGHTPGHVLLKLRDDGEHGLFSGDILHHVFQIFRPELNSSFCEDQQAARITRRKVLDYCVEKDALLFPTHFAAPFVVRVSRDAGGFVPRFVSGQEA
ncbi:MAG: MBL fold metallo-hydrolase, partial [Lautropia sp.]